MSAIGKYVLLAALASSLALVPETGWAQRWGGRGRSGFSVGVGPGGVYAGYGRGGYYGNGYGYGGGWGGYGYGNGFYGGRGYYGGGYYPNYYNNGYYYSSPGVIYSTPSYSTPVYSSSPVISSNAPSNGPAVTTTTGGDVIIENAATNSATLNYSLNGHNYSIQPGQSQRIANDRQWVVEFDRGSGQGTARYSLSQGKFKFKATDNGWDLVRSADQSQSTSIQTAKPPLNGDRVRTFDSEDASTSNQAPQPLNP